MHKAIPLTATLLSLILWGAFPRVIVAATAEDVYLDKCSVCHGPDGAGQTARGKKLKLKDLRSPDVQKLTDAQLNEAITKGKGKDMAAYEKEIDKDTIQQIVVYVRELAKKK